MVLGSYVLELLEVLGISFLICCLFTCRSQPYVGLVA